MLSRVEGVMRRLAGRMDRAQAPPQAPEAAAPAAAPGRLKQPLPRSLFNEAAYLQANPDVAAAAAEGRTTAYDHYASQGYLDEAQGLRPQSLPTQAQRLGMRWNADDALLDRVIDLEIEKRALLAAWDAQKVRNPIDFEALSEDVDDAVAPPLDRTHCEEAGLDEDQRFWRREGYLIKRGFIPEDLIDSYSDVRRRHPSPHGWSCPVPYMYVPELREVSLYPPLMKLMERLVGEEMGLHLNLTGWLSTERNWHQDDYLNPPFINSWYAAVWIALDDIGPDCGPFQFVPGSHRWPLMKSHKVRMFLAPEEREHHNWSKLSERFVDDIAEAEIARRGVEPEAFLAKKGDLLIWHGRLMHRGSLPNAPGTPRRALISHYSGLTHRIDMPNVARTAKGSAYFRHDIPIDFDPYAEQIAAA